MIASREGPAERFALLTGVEVASLFGVRPSTVTRWAEQGRLPVVRMNGGHRRFPKLAVMELLQATVVDRTVGS